MQIPFMEIKDFAKEENTEDEVYDRTGSVIQFEGHKLEFNNIILEEPGDTFKDNLLNLTINEGEIVLIYEKDARSRDLLLYGLTKNLPKFNDPALFKSKGSTIKLGGVSIKNLKRSRTDWIIQSGSQSSAS